MLATRSMSGQSGCRGVYEVVKLTVIVLLSTNILESSHQLFTSGNRVL